MFAVEVQDTSTRDIAYECLKLARPFCKVPEMRRDREGLP